MSDKSSTRRQRWLRHLGSTVALVIGGLWFIGSLAPPGSGLIAGPAIIVGALAYRSAKKRQLGEAASTTMRRIMEGLAIVLIAASVLLQNDLKHALKTDPVPNLLVPAWCIIAYAVGAWRARVAGR